MPPVVDLTPMAVAVAIAGALFGPAFAAHLGAYAIILLGWFAGLLYGLYTRAPESKMPVWAYGVFTLLVCLMVTVPASLLAAETIPVFKVEYTGFLFPIAALIPALPDRWGDAGMWLLSKWETLRGVKP
jgi:hypothetical protein